MKINTIIVPCLAVLISVLAPFSNAWAQGSLTPPAGAPGPTMKSLDQIEARTAITNTGSLVTISQPGSYYLTHNLTVSAGDGIAITTNQVTLDLNGFTISSTAAVANGMGIDLAMTNSNTDITIRNGHIKSGVTNNAGTYNGPGFLNGIFFNISLSKNPFNVHVSDISVSGCYFSGIYLGLGNSVVEGCTVKTVSNYGVYADNVTHCTAVDCGLAGIQAITASDCRGQSAGSGAGISATLANNCYGVSSSGTGLAATSANNCYGNSSSGTGLITVGTANGCYGISSSGTGIDANIANACTLGGGTSAIVHKYNMP